MALEQPKKPVGGAFGSFTATHRADFAKEAVGKGGIAKIASEAWKKLSEAEKAPYQKSYEEAKAKYDRDWAAFLEAGGVKSKGVLALRKEKRKTKEEGGGKGKRAKKDLDAPKRPAGGAYGCFVAKNRKAFQKECPGAVTGVAKLAAERWKALPEGDREVFQKEYQAKKAAYEEAMKTYVPPTATDAGEDKDGDEDEGEDEGDGEGEAAKTLPPAAPVDGAVLSEATTLGYKRQLQALIDNKKLEVSPVKALEALKAAGGSVVKAKKALFGA